MILTDEPNNEEALYKICFWTDYTGNNEASIRLHLQIIDEYPYNELAWFNLAAAYQGLKLYEKAIDAYQYAITIDEKFDFAYRNMGDAYIRIRKYKEAIEALEKVMEIAKPEYVIFEAIGHCYDRLKKYAQARFFYRKASHMREEDSKLLYKIACTYYNEKNWNSCFKQLENAMRFRSLQPDYLLLAGECKLHMGHNKEAVQYFSTVVQLKPNKKNGWEALIRCLYKMDLFDEALEQTNAALEITKGFSVLHFYKAAILL
jgi:tetratricopeptide (TPR) repeat protein